MVPHNGTERGGRADLFFLGGAIPALFADAVEVPATAVFDLASIAFC
jgi:hypothetical protein